MAGLGRDPSGEDNDTYTRSLADIAQMRLSSGSSSSRPEPNLQGVARERLHSMRNRPSTSKKQAAMAAPNGQPDVDAPSLGNAQEPDAGTRLDAKIAALKLIASRGLGIENAPGIGLTYDELGRPIQRMAELAASQDAHYPKRGENAGGYRGAQQCGTGKSGAVDCSGFVSHGLEISRDPHLRKDDGPYWKGKWLETSNIYRDATGPQERFQIVDPEHLRPGDFAVYPDYKRNGEHHQGHIMGIEDPVPSPPSVIDSSESMNGPHFRPLPSAKIGPENMQKMVYVRYRQPAQQKSMVARQDATDRSAE